MQSLTVSTPEASIPSKNNNNEAVTSIFFFTFKNVVLRKKIFDFIIWIHRTCRIDFNYGKYIQRKRDHPPILFKIDEAFDKKQIYHYPLNPMKGALLNNQTDIKILIKYNRGDLLSTQIDKITSILNQYPSIWEGNNIWNMAQRYGCDPTTLKLIANNTKQLLRNVPTFMLQGRYYYRYKHDIPRLVDLIDTLFIFVERFIHFPVEFEYSQKFMKLLFQHPKTLCKAIINHTDRLYSQNNNNNNNTAYPLFINKVKVEEIVEENDEEIILKALVMLQQHKVIKINWRDVIIKAIKWSRTSIIDFIVSNYGGTKLLTSGHLNYAIWNSNLIMINYLMTSFNIKPNNSTLNSCLNPKILTDISNNTNNNNISISMEDKQRVLDIISLVLEKLEQRYDSSEDQKKWPLKSIHPIIQSKQLLDTLLSSKIVTFGKNISRGCKLLGSLLFSKDISLLQYFMTHVNQQNEKEDNKNNIIYFDLNYAFNCALRIGSKEILEFLIKSRKESKFIAYRDRKGYQIDRYDLPHDADKEEINNFTELIKYSMQEGAVFFIKFIDIKKFLLHPNPLVWDTIFDILKKGVEEDRCVIQSGKVMSEAMLVSAASCSLEVYNKMETLLKNFSKPCTNYKLKIFKRNIILEIFHKILPCTDSYRYPHMATRILQRILNTIDVCYRFECLYSNSMIPDKSYTNKDCGGGLVWNGIKINQEMEKAREMLIHMVQNKKLFYYYYRSYTNVCDLYLSPVITSVEEIDREKDLPNNQTTKELITQFIRHEIRDTQHYIQSQYDTTIHALNLA